MIHWKNKKVIPYYKDYKPANVYKGSSAVALAKRMTGSGAVNEFRTEYKSTPIKRIVGQSVQESGNKKAAHVMGKTVKWNQLANFYWLTENKQWESEKVNFSNHKATITFTNNETERIYWYLDIANPIATVQGHKYAVYLDIGVSNAVLASKSINYQFRINGTYSRIGSIDFEKKISIWESQGQEIDRASCYQDNGIRNTITPNSKFEVSFSMVDITAIFGTGNEPTSVDDPRIQSLIAYAKSHPEYDEGSLKSVVLNEVTYCGENLFDIDKWLIDNGIKYTKGSDGFYEISLNQPLYSRPFKFDGLKTRYLLFELVNVNTTNPRIAVLNGSNHVATYYNTNNNVMQTNTFDGIRFDWTVAGNIKLRISVSDTPISSIKPYNGQTVPFTTPLTLNGLTTKDEIYSYVDNGYLVTKKVERNAKVDLETLNFTSFNGAYAVVITGIKGLESTTVVPIQTLVSKYEYDGGINSSSSVQYIADKSYALFFNPVYPRLIIKDSSYTSAAELKASLNGAMFVYPLVTPIITEISRVPLVCDFDDASNIIVANENAGLVEPDTSYSMDPFPTPYIPSEVVSSSKIDIQHNNHYYEINGLTGKWNQLSDIIIGSIQAKGVTITAYNDGRIVANGTATDLIVSSSMFRMKQLIAGHVYFLIGCPNGGGGQTYDLRINTFSTVGVLEDYGNGSINQKSRGGNEIAIVIRKDYNCQNLTFNPRLVDLTDIFGAGSEPTSVDDPRIQRLIEIAKRRPQYDAGSLLSASKIYDQDDNLLYELSNPIKSAGDAHDVLCTNGQVKVNMGDVDLGTLNWYTDDRYTHKQFYATLAGIKYGAIKKLSDSSYQAVVGGWGEKPNKTFGSDYDYIIFADDSYNNASSFKAAMSGVILVYELSVPAATTISSKWLPAGLTFHDEYGRSLTSTYKEEILTDVIDIESSGIGTATDEIWVNRASTNLWDEEWERGFFGTSSGTDIDSTNQIRSKNLIKIIPNSTYYFSTPNTVWIMGYDEKQNIISLPNAESGVCIQARNVYRSFPNNCHYIRFYTVNSYGATYKNDIAIIEGTSGEYEPYAKNKVISIKRIGSVDLGTLGWQKTSGNLFYSIIDDVKQGVGTWGTVLGMCTKYVRNPISALTLLDKEFCIGSLAIESSGKNIAIREDSQSDPTTFKQSLSGTMLYYELANPVITDITNTSLGQALLTKTYPNSNHRISIDFGSIDVQWFEAK